MTRGKLQFEFEKKDGEKERERETLSPDELREREQSDERQKTGVDREVVLLVTLLR